MIKEGKKMVAGQCTKCNRKLYPIPTRCPDCKNREFKEFELETKAKVVTYTILKAIPKGVKTSPLVVGIVEFPSGVRATGQLLTKDPQIDMVVRPDWGFLRKIGEKEEYGFRYALIDDC